MDAKILRSLMNYNLTEEESIPIQLDKADLIDRVVECEASIFVKIPTLKESFGLILASRWCTDYRLKLRWRSHGLNLDGQKNVIHSTTLLSPGGQREWRKWRIPVGKDWGDKVPENTAGV
ncbi:hypothetical protein LIER_34085 [Lithospermum erythrorhizon]|uniref:Uncharacterized protein n=1 Tax=Lithospermum erythrorhizon TaxID=34254 RepID=A0AAV3S278_LITER